MQNIYTPTSAVAVASRRVLAHRVAITLETMHAKEVIKQVFARHGVPEITDRRRGQLRTFGNPSSVHL